ncbi:hypothetical protein [Tepidibacillus marianensis]|uniref:anti-sigma factor family protein n=1 Tax=Tepidibacillus marianensis TaxID=3131995 RepID=UPI0030D4A29E
MSCSQYEHLIQGYIDQSITVEEKKELNEHIQVCDYCREELQEMIEVVSYMEDIGDTNHKRVKQRIRKLKSSLLATCMTVCSAVVLVLYYPSNNAIFNADGPNIEYRNIVLADDSEQLPLPDKYEYYSEMKRGKYQPSSLILNHLRQGRNSNYDIIWVYPSIYNHIDEIDLDELSDEYVFINVPNERTLHQLMALLKRENIYLSLHVTHYPVSIVIDRGDQELLIREVEFPTEIEQFHHKLDEVGTPIH